MDESRNWGPSTTALHAGFTPVSEVDWRLFRSFVPPVVQSAIYPLDDVEHYTRIVQGLEPGFDYGRNSNPTVEVLQQRLAALEGGEQCIALPSGMHAVFALTHHLCEVDSEVVTSHRIFGEAYGMFYHMAPRKMGITTRLVEDPGDLDEWASLITDKTRFLWAETPSNPTLFVMDIAGLAEVAHAHDVPLIVDNTLVTSALQQPFDLGADVVALSLTKFLIGNGAIVGGAVIGSEELITGIGKTIAQIGAIMSPFDAWLSLLCIETLPLRMARHSANAEAVVDFLKQHPRVTHINYPTLTDHPQHALASRQMPHGCGGLLSFVVSGGREGAIKTMESLKMIPIVPSFGTSRTIATHPVTHTHSGMAPEEREAVGIYDGLIRLSVGLEDPEDIIADLEQALDAR
jgi:cystathionine beta-lyase/cystathionine gamma-synthase